MPRRLKDGLDYFPLDVRFFSDTRIRRLSVEYGPDGPLIYIMFLTMAYSQNGYYIEGTLDRLAYAIFFDIRFKEQEKDVSYGKIGGSTNVKKFIFRVNRLKYDLSYSEVYLYSR